MNGLFLKSRRLGEEMSKASKVDGVALVIAMRPDGWTRLAHFGMDFVAVVRVTRLRLLGRIWVHKEVTKEKDPRDRSRGKPNDVHECPDGGEFKGRSNKNSKHEGHQTQEHDP